MAIKRKLDQSQESVRLNIRVPKSLIENLDKISSITGQTRAAICKEILRIETQKQLARLAK